MTTLDLAVLIGYFVGITAFGLWLARRIKGSDSYFRGERKFRWWIMMGQAFGTGTHAEMPVAQAGASYQLGFAAIWFQWKNLLITPFYWLLGPWYRRSERTTVAEMLEDRYGSRMGLIYAIFAILFFVFNMGAMLQGAAKVISVASGDAISPNGVVIGMTVAFMLYSFFGGLIAAAHTEFIQAFLIIVLSFLLIPSGLGEVGGFTGLKEALPENFFLLYSEESGLGAFMIAMLALNGVVGITAQPHMMAMFGTGNTERAGRVGQTYGTFVKRLVTIGWALVGLIVAAMMVKAGTELEDPEYAFGYASRLLLGSGLTGLMIACILAANMSTCSNFMVNTGALFTLNLYQRYLKPDAKDQTLLRMGRISGLVLAVMGVLFALIIENVLAAFLFTETIAAFMGIAVFGGMVWKRANFPGAIGGVVMAFVLYYVLNYLREGQLQFIYSWQPEPFGWAMLAGFSTLLGLSLLTRPEDPRRLEAFFDQMERKSDMAPDPETGKKPLAAPLGHALILLDVPGWFRSERWDNFFQRYREDFWGFLLAWAFVGVLILLAWSMLQLG